MSEVAPGHLAQLDYRPHLSWDYLGWGEESQTFDERLYIEETAIERAMSAQPSRFQWRDPSALDAVVAARWQAYQEAKGYDAGSCDLTLFGDFVFGRRFHWLPQKTGSCTISNTFRMAYRRQLWEIVARGELEELLGRDEFGPDTVAFYAPLSYGIARQIGGLRSGDGGFCGPTIESLMLGVLDCNNERLSSILRQHGATAQRDYPEPQDNRVYRTFQNWTYNDELKSQLKCPLTESVKVTTVEQLDRACEEYKPVIMCSMLAVMRGGEYRGLSYFVPNPRDRWAHNMCWGGKIIWQGRTFYLLSNESWRDDLIYAIPADAVEDIFRRYRPECMTLGAWDMENSLAA